MFEEIVRVYSTLENPNVLGEYLLFVIPLAMAMVLLCKASFPNFIMWEYYMLCIVLGLHSIKGLLIGIMFGLLFIYSNQ